MHPCYPVQSKPQSTGTKCLLSPALMVTPIVLPSIPLHNWVSPHHPHHLPSRETGKPNPGEKQSLSPDSATLPFAPTGSAHPRGFLPTPAGRHPHRGLLPTVERSRAQPVGRGAPEGAWLETEATWALAGSRVLPACLQSLPGKLYPPALLHPVSWVEKRNPHPSTHTLSCQLLGHLEPKGTFPRGNKEVSVCYRGKQDLPSGKSKSYKMQRWLVAPTWVGGDGWCVPGLVGDQLG